MTMTEAKLTDLLEIVWMYSSFETYVKNHSKILNRLLPPWSRSNWRCTCVFCTFSSQEHINAPTSLPVENQVAISRAKWCVATRRIIEAPHVHTNSMVVQSEDAWCTLLLHYVTKCSTAASQVLNNHREIGSPLLKTASLVLYWRTGWTVVFNNVPARSPS